MHKIKFGTDGWRAVIAKDFTVENVARVSKAAALWVLNNYSDPSVVIGYDSRFGGKLFAETAARIFARNNVKVYISESFVTTPMVSIGIIRLKAKLGVVITASHNPSEYNGYKLKGEHGGPLLDRNIKCVEDLIPGINEIILESIDMEEEVEAGMISFINLESMYVEAVNDSFDMESIREHSSSFAFDAMYGAGQNVIKKLLPDIKKLHCEVDLLFDGIPPEPLHRNLNEFSKMIKRSNKITSGIAVDGDADRIAMYDEDGEYVDSHHIILLLIHYLAKYRKLKGKVVTGFSSTIKIEKLCRLYKLEVQRVKIGFKQICEVMLTDNVLVGGEESGGISIMGHIPERDGIWMGLTIWQFMVNTGKSLKELIEEVYKITGEFAFERSDLHIDHQLKKEIVQRCENREYSSFGPYKVKKVEDLDGYKFFFNKEEWVMIRPSGTEPVLRIYAEAKTGAKAGDILKKTYETIVPEEFRNNGRLK